MATCSSILTWRTAWTEEPGGLQPMVSQRARHDRACTACYLRGRRRVRHNLVTEQQQHVPCGVFFCSNNILKYFELNEDITDNLWDAEKRVLRESFIALVL